MAAGTAGEHGGHPSLAPRARERLRALLAPPVGTRGWARTLLLRRLVALLLALLAAGLALWPAGTAGPAPAAPRPAPADHNVTATAPLAGGPDTAAVPIRLADPAVAALLHPGTEVDVISSTGAAAVAGGHGSGDAEGAVLAADATVAAVRTTGGEHGDHGRLVVLRLPRDDATRVAAASLDGAVAVTLRPPG